MAFYDLLRYAIMALFGVGIGFMLMTNCIAFMVLRPPQRLGFLWWHVTSISISFLCLGLVSVERVVGSLGQPPTWRTWTVLAGTALFATAQAIIFSVERQRLIARRSLGVASACHAGTYTGQ